ncbi:MAG: hypothetical protein DI622_08390 [Chryseobacterium sp.]|nr:MAG: hypothetical protein DI622_08390 [Chryseobacterium sp.]
MNCRCVKMKFDQNGEELGVIPKNQVSAGLGSSPGLATTNVEKKEDELVLYPNPVHNTLFIKGGTDKLYQFQVYNAAGQLVLAGQFKNNQADLSGLSLGVYLVKINNGEMITKIIKR